MIMKKLFAAFLAACGIVFSAIAKDGTVPSDGVYKFSFGSSNTPDGYTHVETNDVYNAGTDYAGTGNFTYGFLGTQEDSYKNDKPWSLKVDPRQIDGFYVVQKQWIKIRDLGTGIAGPLKADYEPEGASTHEGRYPVRFSFSAEQKAYYAVTCTVVNVSSTDNADVTLFSERCHIIAHHLTLKPSETRTFAWSVELWPNVMKQEGTYTDDAINVVVVGENAGLQSVIAVKQPQTTGAIRGEATDKMNVGKTMWLCDDSTGTDQNNLTPYFSLQNYSGVGSGLSRWARPSLCIRNQGEGGLATNDQAHRRSCQLKPGDYLYVEYGHNESGATSYTNNLEKYLADVDTAKANLIIVSPVERRSDWDSTNQKWNRSLGGYATAGANWVTNKILEGHTNVAFIDLNKRYNDWMNQEIVRIHDVNTKVSLAAAISYYYRSAKGAHVDDTHINNAGTDQAAYWVWYDALQTVAAAENADPDSVLYKEAQVLKGITEGYQGYVGNSTTEVNEPWSVTDDIINAGVAPNEYWDTPVTTGYKYVNEADIASIDATANEDGSVTLSGVTMRILNPDNYYKAVIEVVNSDGTVTNTYYSYYNYDVGGAAKQRGDLVTPNEVGFLDGDKAKDDVTGYDRLTIEIPSGSMAHVWMAVADAGTWQVGENGPCSPKYPVKWWSQTILDESCATADNWKVNSAAVWTTNIVDNGLYFTTTGANQSNKKQAFGMVCPLNANIEAGCYRFSFKAMFDAGEVSYVVSSGLADTTTSPHKDYVSLVTFTPAVTGYKGMAPIVTVNVDDDGNETPQAKINTSSWTDVDLIIDRDNARAWMSVGGSEYVSWHDESFLPGTALGKTWGYFGIATPSQIAAYGYVKDVKIQKLASVTYPQVKAKAAPNDATMGSVTINDLSVNQLAIYTGNNLTLKATSADTDFYRFNYWVNNDDSTMTAKSILYFPSVTANADYTAVFTAYAHDDNRVITWDFSEYLNEASISGVATNITSQGMKFYLTSGDALTSDGLKWVNSANSGKSDGKTIVNAKYIVYTPVVSGTLALKFSVDNYASSRAPTVVINAANTASECSTDNKLTSVSISKINTEYTLSYNLTAGQTYYIWPYSYNWTGSGWSSGSTTHTYTIPSITYTYAPVYYTFSATADGEGTAMVSDAETLAGRSVTFAAQPATKAYKFTAWTSVGDEGAVVTNSTEAVYTVTASENLALTAHFEARTAGETFADAVDFSRYGVGVTNTAVSVVSNSFIATQLVKGDCIDADGIHWQNPAVDGASNGFGTVLSASADPYITFTAPCDGTVTFDVSVSSYADNRKPAVMIKAATSAGNCTNDVGDAKITITAANQVFTLSHDVTAGTTYFVWVYAYNASAGNYHPQITISNITFTDLFAPVTLTSAVTPANCGTVTLNGYEQTSIVAQKGEAVLMTATPIAKYELASWKNADGTVLSTDAAYWHQAVSSETITANFLAEEDVEITRTVDFSVFGGDYAITGAAAWSQLVGRMEIHGAAGDTLTTDGVYWAGPGTTESDTSKNTSNRYIKFVCVKSGTVKMVYHSNYNETKNHARMYVTDGTTTAEDCMYKNNSHVTNVDASAADTDTTLTATVEAGKTYYIWPYFYHQTAAKFYISSISYTATKGDYNVLTLANYQGSGTNATMNVYYGDIVTVTTPELTTRQIFTGWQNASEETVSTATSMRLQITAAATYTSTYRDPDMHDFTWNANVASGSWQNAANWLYENRITAWTIPSDSSCDVVTFASDAAVSLAAKAVASNVTVNAALTLTGVAGQTYDLEAVLIDGTGTNTLANTGFCNRDLTQLVIKNTIVMTPGTTNWFQTVASDDYKPGISMEGNISGTGAYKVMLANRKGANVYFKGNNNDFVGEAYTSGGNSNRSVIQWTNENAAGTNTYWHIDHSYGNYNSDSYSMGSTMKLGGYDGAWWTRQDGYLLTIGYLNRDSTIKIYNGESNRANSVKKIGSANLTLGTTTIKNLTVEAGTVTLPIGIKLGTLTMSADAGLILPALTDWTEGTVTNLFSYTTLSGVTTDELAAQVSLSGLAAGYYATISVSDNVVSATINVYHPNFSQSIDAGVASVTYTCDGAEVSPDDINAFNIADGKVVTVSYTLKEGYSLAADCTVPSTITMASADVTVLIIRTKSTTEETPAITVDDAPAVTNQVENIVEAGGNPTGVYTYEDKTTGAVTTNTCVAVTNTADEVTVGAMRACTVATFLDVSQLSDGTILKVYDSKSKAYIPFALSDGKWSYAGEDQSTSTVKPENTNLDAGDAALLEKGSDDDVAVQLFTDTIDSTKGVSAAKGATLKCLPSLTAKTVTSITATKSDDTSTAVTSGVEVYTNNGTTQYGLAGGHWYRIDEDEEGNSTVTPAGANDKIEAGTGIFIRNHNSASATIK